MTINDEVNSCNAIHGEANLCDSNSSKSTQINDTPTEKKEKKPNKFVAWLKKIKPSKRKIISS